MHYNHSSMHKVHLVKAHVVNVYWIDYSIHVFQNACMVYKHAYLNTLLLLHSTLMLSVVKMPLKLEVGGHAFNSHENYTVDHGKSWKTHGIVFLCKIIYQLNLVKGQFS